MFLKFETLIYLISSTLFTARVLLSQLLAKADASLCCKYYACLSHEENKEPPKATQ